MSYHTEYHRLTAFYNEDKEFISVYDTGVPNAFSRGSYELKVPYGAEYLRTNVATSLLDEFVIYPNNKKYDLTNLIGYQTIEPAIKKVVSNNYFYPRNLVNMMTIYEDEFIQTVGSIIYQSNYTTTDYIKVKPNETYRANMHRRTAFYDENKILINLFITDVLSEDTEINTPPHDNVLENYYR